MEAAGPGPTAGDTSSARLESVRDVRRASLEGGYESGEQAGRERCDQGEADEAAAHPPIGERHVRQQDLVNRAAEQTRDQERRGCSHSSEHETLGDRLESEASAAGSERQADRDLPSCTNRPSQH